MKKIRKICIIITIVIIIYTFVCFGFRRVIRDDGNGVKYRGEKYNYCDIFRVDDNYSNQKMISLGFMYTFPLWSITYYARTRDCPDIILQPRGYSVYLKNNFNPKTIVCNVFIEKNFNLFEKKYDKIELGDFSIDDIVDIELDELDYIYNDAIEVCIWIKNDYYNIVAINSSILMVNDNYYLMINGHSYTISENFKKVLDDKII